MAAATLLAMTPRYASPEQVRGAAITTATDVYSLGVILYELLTGSRPLSPGLATTLARCSGRSARKSPRNRARWWLERVGSGTRGAGATSAGRSSPPLGASTERRSRHLRGELDNIVLQALRKEPERRYGSVGALSEDIARHLDGRPVSARKLTAGYRLAKFVRRHTVGVAAAALLFALTLSFAVATAVQANRIARERDKAEQLAAFMVDLFKVSDPSAARGNTITAREVLDRGVERIERELQDEPEVKAALLATMGAVYTGLGLYDQARPMLESSLAARRELLGPNERRGGREPAQPRDSAVARRPLSRGREALPRGARDAARTERRRSAAGDHDPPRSRATCWRRRGTSSGGRGDRPRGDRAPATDARAAARRPVVSLGRARRYPLPPERPDRSRSAHPEAIALRQQVGLEDDPRAATWVLNLATFRHARGDYAGAETAFEEGLAVYRKVLGAEHPEVARNLNNFAAMLHEQGNYERAESLAGEAVAIYRRTVGDDHPDLAAPLDTLAAVLNSRGEHERAEAASREAVAIMRRAVGDDHLYVAYDTKTLADALQGQGRLAEAAALYRRVIAINDQVLPADSLDRTYALLGLGTAPDRERRRQPPRSRCSSRR